MKNRIQLMAIAVIMLIQMTAAYGQVAITNDGSLPDNSAMLDVKGTDKGLLIPRMTMAERDAISLPAKGLMVFVTDDNHFYYNAGSATLPDWTDMGGDVEGNWIISGDDMYSPVTGNVGIGTLSPTMPLEVKGNYWENIVRIHNGNASGNSLIISSGSNWASISGSNTNRDDISIRHANGNVGINNSNPMTKLDVNGSIRMTDGNEGDGKVMVSDGNGVGSWQTLSTGAQEFGDLNDAYTISDSYYLGPGSGYNDDGTSNNNYGLGYSALASVTEGTNNLAMGRHAQRQNVDGWNNVALGSGALRYNVNGSYNTAVGNQAGGSFNGASFSGCVMIGHQAGIYNFQDNRLYIDNTGSTTPLIGGDFDADRVDINGTIKITGGSPGTGKVLISTNDEGNAAWSDLPAGVQEIDDLSDAVYDSSSLFVGYLAGANDDGGNFNTAFGINVLGSNVSGQANTASGWGSMSSNLDGSMNVAVGDNTLKENTSGSSNVALGFYASYSNTTGYSNIAIGSRALSRATTQHNIVAIGDSALRYNGLGAYLDIHGAQNTAVGSKALYANTLGNQNTAVGFESMIANTEGKDNTGMGAFALQSNISADNNTAMGAFSLTKVETGNDNAAFGYKSAYHITEATSNSAFGTFALYSDSSGINNSAFGRSSLFLNKTGNENTAHGYRALYKNSDGDNNTAIGSYAGYNALGSGNVFIGRNAGKNETGSDKLYIDNTSSDNPLIYGEFDNDSIRINGQISVEEDMAANGDMIAGDDMITGDDVIAGGDVIADNEFKYSDAQTRILKIPAAGFSLFTNQDADKMVCDDNGYWRMDSDDGNGSSNIKAAVNLPDGAEITRFSFYYRNDGEDIQVTLRKKGNYQLQADIMAERYVQNDNFNMIRVDDTTINYPVIDNTDNFYYIYAFFFNHDDLDFGHFHGAEIEYTITNLGH